MTPTEAVAAALRGAFGAPRGWGVTVPEHTSWEAIAAAILANLDPLDLLSEEQRAALVEGEAFRICDLDREDCNGTHWHPDTWYSGR